jgi:hypothetical protein
MTEEIVPLAAFREAIRDCVAALVSPLGCHTFSLIGSMLLGLSTAGEFTSLDNG